ncbi:MAG: hypothetical protein R3Y35_10315 [Clostridia bacterium]
MKKIRIKNNILNSSIDAMNILLFLPLLVIIGKILRWTLMYSTLISVSKGWGYVSEILSGEHTFTFLGINDLVNGSHGEDTNMYLFFKVFRALCLNIPNDFYSFEIAITIVYSVILFALCKQIKRQILVSEFIFVCLAIMILNVYCFSLAKETFQMIYFYILFLVLYTDKIAKNRKFLAATIVMLFSTFTFRTYYFLIILFTLVALFLVEFAVKKKPDKPMLNVVIVFFGLISSYAIMMFVLKSTMPSLYLRMADSLLWASSATSKSNTYTENWIATSSYDTVNVILEYGIYVLRLLFPFELLSLGIKYFPYIVYQLSMTIFTLTTLKTYATNAKSQNVALLFMLGFIFTSATFESDFGSWIRHGVVTLPLVLIMIGLINPKEIKKGEKDANISNRFHC